MNRFTLILVGFVLLIVLAARFFFFYHSKPRYADGQFLTFETTLLSEPQIVGKYQKLSANLASGQKIFITSPIIPQFHYGDAVRISSTLKFSVLKNERVIATMFFPKIEAVKNDKNVPIFLGKNILALVSVVRQKIIFLFEKTFSPAFASLFLGIVFGIKENMPSELTDKLRITGVLHVVAASGMNVTIVGGFLASIFGLFLRRQMAIIASIFGILFYATLAGLEPSIIRASIMGILVFSAQILGRQTVAFYGLFLTGFLMLFVSPNLLFDVGFQLSFAATAGILFIKPIIEHLRGLGGLGRFGKLVFGGEVATTVAAQVATLPILLANFGTYSFWSVAANGLTLWTIPLLMIIGGAGAISSIIFFPAGQFILYLSLPLLLYFEKTISAFSNIQGVFTVDGLSWQIVVGYYSILMSLLLFFSKRNDVYK